MTNIDYLYNPEIVKPAFEKNYFDDKKLGFQVVENGIVLPHKIVNEKELWGEGGIVDSKGGFIKSSHVNASACRKVSIYTPPLESIQHSSETVIYLGLFHKVWGHYITDSIRRLWFLKSDAFKSEFKNCPIVYITFLGKKFDFFSQSFRRLLEILEINIDECRMITQPTQFQKIILPDESFYHHYHHSNLTIKFTNEYREMIERVRNFALKNRTPVANKKLYFFHGMRQFGEERLAEYFKSKGYAIINHEQRADFDEELNLLINCESFASTEGSCSHNSVFLRDNTETIFIPRLAAVLANPFQQTLNSVHMLNINYVDSTMSLSNANNPSNCYIISRQLKRFFGDKWNGYDEEDFKSFLQYVRDGLGIGSKINQYAKEYYDPVLEDFISQLKRREDLIKACDMPKGWETFQPTLSYQTHVHMRGWGDGWKFENQSSNPLDQKLDVLAIKVNFPGHKVYYSVYFNDEEGWSEEVTTGQMAGTVGIRKPIYGMRVRLDEAGAKEFDILYRMHKFDDTWTPWAKNGENLYSYGQKLNAIQIKLEPVKPDEIAKTFDYTQSFLTEGNEIYLQGQRQNLLQ